RDGRNPDHHLAGSADSQHGGRFGDCLACKGLRPAEFRFRGIRSNRCGSEYVHADGNLIKTEKAMTIEQGRGEGVARPISATDALIAALEEAIELLKEELEARENSSTKIAAVIRKGEAAIREARQVERENAVMIKPQPRGVRIEGWDV